MPLCPHYSNIFSYTQLLCQSHESYLKIYQVGTVVRNFHHTQEVSGLKIVWTEFKVMFLSPARYSICWESALRQTTTPSSLIPSNTPYIITLPSHPIEDQITSSVIRSLTHKQTSHSSITIFNHRSQHAGVNLKYADVQHSTNST